MKMIKFSFAAVIFACDSPVFFPFVFRLVLRVFCWNSSFSLVAGTCLRDLKISVPEAVATGDTVTLSCYYNLENVSFSFGPTNDFQNLLQMLPVPSALVAVMHTRVSWGAACGKWQKHEILTKKVPFRMLDILCFSPGCWLRLCHSLLCNWEFLQIDFKSHIHTITWAHRYRPGFDLDWRWCDGDGVCVMGAQNQMCERVSRLRIPWIALPIIHMHILPPQLQCSRSLAGRINIKTF